MNSTQNVAQDSWFNNNEDVGDTEDKLSNNQIVAGKKLVDAFSNTNRWNILLAYPQSGKTYTYMLACAEMIRMKIIDRVVIFSGNADTELKKELTYKTKEGDVFYDKYRLFLQDQFKKNHTTLTSDTIERKIKKTIDKIKDSIDILWGVGLKKASASYTKTLFAWDESHHAQSKTQCPDKFLNHIGIDADGNLDKLIQNDNYFISISATPFSELYNKARYLQPKQIIGLFPDTGYISTQTIIDNGKLIFFPDVMSGLSTALMHDYGRYVYAIVRITKKSAHLVIEHLKSFTQWKCVIYDSASEVQEKIKATEEKKTNKKTTLMKTDGQQIWENINTDVPPLQNTVVLIKGRCRMGKELKKTNIGFVMETSKNANTDTLVQGLLGRVNGYAEGSANIFVYLHKKYEISGVIDRYNSSMISAMNGEPIVDGVDKANNVIKSNTHTPSTPIIPVKISRNIPDFNIHKERLISRPVVIQSVVDALSINNNPCVTNKNNVRVLNHIKHILHSGTSFNIKCGKLKSRETNSVRGIQKARELIASFEEGVPIKMGCGNGSLINEINIWCILDLEDHDNSTLYITCSMPTSAAVTIPSTTGKEVFKPRLRLEIEVDEEPIDDDEPAAIDEPTAIEEDNSSVDIIREREELFAIPRSHLNSDEYASNLASSHEDIAEIITDYFSIDDVYDDMFEPGL